MTKKKLIQELEAAFEQFIAVALEAEKRGIRRSDGWGPREIAAHLAGWEVMASVRVPAIVAGMSPLEESSLEREEVMDAAMNTTFAALIGDQSLDAVIGILRHAYQRDIQILKELEDRFFQPGEYVYERTKGVIEHCQEHGEELTQ